MKGISIVTEHDFTVLVIDLARLHGWRVAHFRPAMTKDGWRTAVQGDGAGFPDLVLVRANRLLFAELKTDRGILTGEQRSWLNGLRGAHSEVYLWRPKDYNEIEQVLIGRDLESRAG
jgi:VRR-NUC domain